MISKTITKNKKPTASRENLSTSPPDEDYWFSVKFV